MGGVIRNQKKKRKEEEIKRKEKEKKTWVKLGGHRWVVGVVLGESVAVVASCARGCGVVPRLSWWVVWRGACAWVRGALARVSAGAVWRGLALGGGYRDRRSRGPSRGRGVCPSRCGLLDGYHDDNEHQGRLRRRYAMAAPPLTRAAVVIESPSGHTERDRHHTGRATLRTGEIAADAAERHPLAAGAGRPKGWAPQGPISGLPQPQAGGSIPGRPG